MNWIQAEGWNRFLNLKTSWRHKYCGTLTKAGRRFIISHWNVLIDDRNIRKWERIPASFPPCTETGSKDERPFFRSVCCHLSSEQSSSCWRLYRCDTRAATTATTCTSPGVKEVTRAQGRAESSKTEMMRSLFTHFTMQHGVLYRLPLHSNTH